MTPTTGNRPVLTPSESPMRVLTPLEYRNSLARLLHLEPSAVGTLPPASLQNYGFSTVASGHTTLSEDAIERALDNAAKATAMVFSDPKRRVDLVGCTPSSFNDACVSSFFQRIARLAFRGKQTPELVAQYKALGTVLPPKDLWKPIELATAAILASPHFLFRTEAAKPLDQVATVGRFEGVDLASRLAFALTQTTPSADLLDAAERGELDTKQGLERHARRLLESGAAISSAQAFFAENLRLERLETLTKDNTRWPQFTPQLRQAMLFEVESLATQLVRDTLDLRRLYDFDKTFANAELAALYGMPPPASGWIQQSHTQRERAGLLSTGAFLSTQASFSATSPTHRGKYVLENVLCEVVPPVPPNVDNVLPSATPSSKKTLRQRLNDHVASPSCQGCHVRMDTIGFGFEAFDAIGQLRNEDEGLPLDTSASLHGQPFSSPRELGALLANSRQAATCLVERPYRQLTASQHLTFDRAAFETVVDELTATRFDWTSLVVAIVTSDGFRFATQTP
jgi:hypothetical protein